VKWESRKIQLQSLRCYRDSRGSLLGECSEDFLESKHIKRSGKADRLRVEIDFEEGCFHVETRQIAEKGRKSWPEMGLGGMVGRIYNVTSGV
jgi:hypothetical protein